MIGNRLRWTCAILIAVATSSPAYVMAVGWDSATRVDIGTRKNGGSGAKYYLRDGGNDSKDGMSPANAFKTFNKAMEKIEAGCTLYVGAGTYNEKVEVKKSGTFDGGTNMNCCLIYADVQGTFTGDAGAVIIRNSNDHGIKCDDHGGVIIDGFSVIRSSQPAADKKYHGIKTHHDSILVYNCEFANWTHGAYCDETSPTFVNCSFHNCVAWGVAVKKASVTLTNCTVEANAYGGVNNYRDWDDKDILVTDPVATLTNCKINNNPRFNVHVTQSTLNLDGTEVTNSSGFGILLCRGYFNFSNNYKISGNYHGVFLHGRDEDHVYDYSLNGLRVDQNNGIGLSSYFYDLTLTNCNFGQNGQTGFVACFGDISLTNCTATNNGNGGFFYFAYQRIKKDVPTSYGTAYFTNCTASTNQFHGIYCFCADTFIENCTLTNNQNHGAYIVARNYQKHPDPKVEDDGYDVKVVKPWWDTFTWAFSTDKHPYQYDGEVFFQSTAVTGNGSNGIYVHGYDWEKDVKLPKNKKKNKILRTPTAFVIDQCNISSNGGMGITASAVDVQATYLVIQSNGSKAVTIENGVNTFENCLITDNYDGAYFTKGLSSTSAGTSLWNCTIAKNSNGSGVYQDVASVEIANCILSQNGNYGLFVNSGTMNHHDNLVYGHVENFHNTSAATSEIISDPRFVSATTKNYQLSANSRAINKGIDAPAIVDDLLSVPRPKYVKWEMGCYEYPYPSGVRSITKWKEIK